MEATRNIQMEATRNIMRLSPYKHGDSLFEGMAT
jgi:hypothetical protein